MRRVPFAFACLTLLAPLRGAGESADFLLPGHPASLEILDRYEQPLSTKEKSGLPAFLPLQVVKEKALLGDGITSVKEVRFEGYPYYLLRSDGADPAGVHRIRGGRVLDGVEKAAGADLRCATGAKPGGTPRAVKKGQPLQPVFSQGAHTYVKILGPKVEFAWCPAGGPFLEKKIPDSRDPVPGNAGTASGNGLDPDLEAVLRARMESANKAYAAYTGAFNRLTGESRAMPRWECALLEDGMRCNLADAPESGGLDQSNAVLAEELRKSLGGRPFEVTLAKRELKVTPRREKDSRGP
jgi:hypothetical protein